MSLGHISVIFPGKLDYSSLKTSVTGVTTQLHKSFWCKTWEMSPWDAIVIKTRSTFSRHTPRRVPFLTATPTSPYQSSNYNWCSVPAWQWARLADISLQLSRSTCALKGSVWGEALNSLHRFPSQWLLLHMVAPARFCKPWLSLMFVWIFQKHLGFEFTISIM